MHILQQHLRRNRNQFLFVCLHLCMCVYIYIYIAHLWFEVAQILWPYPMSMMGNLISAVSANFWLKMGLSDFAWRHLTLGSQPQASASVNTCHLTVFLPHGRMAPLHYSWIKTQSLPPHLKDCVNRRRGSSSEAWLAFRCWAGVSKCSCLEMRPCLE